METQPKVDRHSRSRSPIRTEEARKLGGGGDRRSGGGPRRGGPGNRGGPGGDRSDRKPVFNEHSDRMVYISNLPYEMKWNTLKDLIREKSGELAHVEVLEDRNGKSKGAAVAEFDSKQSAVKAIESLHRADVNGRLIVVKEIRDPAAFFRKVKEDTGIDFLGGRGPRPGAGGRDAGRRVPIQSNDHETYGLSPAFLDKLGISTPLVNRIFIANIPYNCGVGKLYDVFTLAGKITWFDLQMDQDGKSKGIAVVQYSHPIEAVQAISMLDGQRLLDRTLSVKMDRFEKEAQLRPGELPSGLRGVGMGLGANGAPLADVASVISTFSRQPTMNGPSMTSPFVAPQVHGYTNGTSAPQMTPGIPQTGGYGQPQTVNPGYNTAPIYNAPTQPTGNQFYNTAPQQTIPPTSAAMPSYGTPTQQQQPIGTSYQQAQQAPGYSAVYSTGGSKNILIKNLPMDYTWQIVSDRVQAFGDLESVEMISPGVAKVRFVRISDAENAQKQLHGTTVEGRQIAVEFL